MSLSHQSDNLNRFGSLLISTRPLPIKPIFKGDRPSTKRSPQTEEIVLFQQPTKIMPEDINKSYVERYLRQARSTDNEDLQNNALYRAGTQMEVIECNGDNKLTSEQRQTVLDAADKLLGSGND